MRMFSPLWQKNGFDEKLTVLWRSDHYSTFHSAPIVKYTENRPLPDSWRRGVNKIGKKQISCGSSNFDIWMCHNLSSDHFDDKSLKDSIKVSHKIHFRHSNIFVHGGNVVNL